MNVRSRSGTAAGDEVSVARPATAAQVEAVIEALAGPGARPRADQLEAVRALVELRRRVLVVQATGWGKSAVYWAATAALRAAGSGATLVVSPLLALMHDQVAAARRAGLRAATINSANFEEWDLILEELAADRLDVLLVSPERLANPRFGQRLGPLVRRCGLLVVDEAHCISDWGFDFRPDYQRLSRLLLQLAADTPVLATTATANTRVTADVAAQLGPETLVLRGPLARASLRLAVTPQLGPLDRYAWVADALEQLPGSGIIYTLTVAEADRMAEFLRSEGIEAVAYHGRLGPQERSEVEQRLRVNAVKAVVATSALGMGYDKPDLAFVVHLGSPASPVAYYQQVGRAGRALDDAVAVLLPSDADERIWTYFAEASIPDPDAARQILAVLERNGPTTLPALEQATGQRRGRLESLLKIMAVDGALEPTPAGWSSTGQGWTFDTAKYGALLAMRSEEADLMRRYARGAGCLMQFLQEALGDVTSAPCGRCSVCTATLPHPGERPSRARRQAVRTFLRGLDTVLEPRKMWPSGRRERKGRIGGRIEPGRALAYADDPAWADAIAGLDRADGPIGTELAAGVRDALDRWRPGWAPLPSAVVPVPSRRHPQRVGTLASLVGEHLGLPVRHLLAAAGPPPPTQVASLARVDALFDGLSAPGDGGVELGTSVLLVDDTYRTGWTMTVAGERLAALGVERVLPFVLHQQP